MLTSELLPQNIGKAEAIEENDTMHLKYKELGAHYYDAMVNQQMAIKGDLPHWTPGKRAIPHNSYTFRRLSYSRHLEGRVGGMIFFQPHRSDVFIPGVIHKIYSQLCLVNCTLLAVHCFQPCPEHVADPFRSFPTFGAKIWSRAMSTTIEIIPGIHNFHHAIVQCWDESTYVLKSTATVSQRVHDLGWHITLSYPD